MNRSKARGPIYSRVGKTVWVCSAVHLDVPGAEGFSGAGPYRADPWRASSVDEAAWCAPRRREDEAVGVQSAAVAVEATAAVAVAAVWRRPEVKASWRETKTSPDRRGLAWAVIALAGSVSESAGSA